LIAGPGKEDFLAAHQGSIGEDAKLASLLSLVGDHSNRVEKAPTFLSG